MFNKYILLSILIITSVFSSGCIFENNNKANQSIGPDFILKTNLPAGFTYLGIHETTINIANSTVSRFEGVYRYGGEDIYIAAYKNDDPEALLSQYKADLRKNFRKDYNPFEEISINGHAATKLTDVIVLDGKNVPRYSIIWANKGYMIQVGSFADVNPVVVLASATGY
ncbi:MAG: hypothetical protein D4R88_07290 [Methanosarcinales archaeon]|nr:MAG: hypothetical protein D4R88_07290 [Methanosarcinales archaeon]